MGKYAGPGMAVVGAAMCFGMENAGNKEKTDQQILEDTIPKEIREDYKYDPPKTL